VERSKQNGFGSIHGWEKWLQAQLNDIHSLDQYRAVGIYAFRAASMIGAAVGGTALLLTLSGIYGVISYFVTQRTKEIGIRVALGATTQTVTALVLKQSLRLAAIGMALGPPSH